MKNYQWMAIAVVMTLPSCCFAQTWQASSPGRINNAPAYPTPYQGTVNNGSGNQSTAVNDAHYAMPGATFSDVGDGGSGASVLSQNQAGQESSGYGAPGFEGGCGIGGGCDSTGEGACNPCGETTCCSGGGTYFSIFGGLADIDSQNSTGLQRDLQIQFDQGYGIGGAIGRRVSRCLRSELEYVYRSQNPGAVEFNGNLQNNISGQQNSHAGMFNLICDLMIAKGNLVPYLGAGIGVASIDSQVRYGTMGSTLDGDDSAFAVQWMAGLTYRARPNMEMFVEYRFFEIEDPKLNRFGGPPINGAPANIILDSEYISNDIFTGIRFNF